MSHLKERKEKICLNCRSEVHGKYCHVCGQENIEPFETAWHLIKHFFNDLTHFDGKFFSTLKYLIIKPGFVSREYMLGRRASYLNPIRMYIFTSAIFFLIFFSITNLDKENLSTKFNGKTLSDIAVMDSLSFIAFTKEINNGKPLSRDEFKTYVDTTTRLGFRVSPSEYKNKAEYDSALKAGKADNWIERKLTYKQIALNEKYKNDRSLLMAGFINSLLHSFPQMLFISLPLFALLLKLLYVRRKEYYYASHIIFGVHLYIFTFIFLLFIIGLNQFKSLVGWDWIKYFVWIAYIYIFYYQYKSMRNFYGQHRGKTILKFFVLNLMLLFLIILLFIVFSFFSLLKM